MLKHFVSLAGCTGGSVGEFIAIIGISVFLLGIKERLSKNPLPKQVFCGR